MPVRNVAASKFLKIRAVENVALSTTALITVPRLGRVKSVIIQLGYTSGTNTVAGAAAHIAGIRVKVNGREQRKFGSGTELRDFNLLHGTAYDCTGAPNTAPGVSFPIYFAEPWRMDEADQDVLAWESREWDSFTIEVDIGPSASSSSAPTLAATIEYAMDRVNSPGIVSVERISIPASGTAFDWSSLSNKEFLEAISLYPDSGGSNALTQLDVRFDGELFYEGTATQNKARLQGNGLTPAASGRTASMYDYVADADGLLKGAIDTRNVATTTLSFAAGSSMSGAIVALVSRIGGLL